MTEKFEVRILPIRHCHRYNIPEYKLAAIQFDIVQDIEGFDERKVSDPVEVPERIFFHFENKKKLSINGNEDDFSVVMESEKE